MWNLVKSELARFRGLAMALAAVHSAILFFRAVSGDLFAFREDLVLVSVMIYALTGLIAGLYQVGTWRRPHLWTYLIHRPLSPARIFTSLVGAMAMLLLGVVALPLVIATFVADKMTWYWVDERQYLLSVFVYLTVLVFYLIGCFIMLSASRAACLLLVLPFLFLTGEASGLWIFLLQAVVLLWTGFLAYAAFQPNLSAHLRGPFAVVFAALPMQYVFFWAVHFVLLVAYSTLVAFSEHGWKGYALHGWDEYFDEGTYARVSYMSHKEALAHGLRLSQSPRARQLLDLVENAQAQGMAPIYTKPQWRGQLPLVDLVRVWRDGANQVDWTFSHDFMRFHGRHRRHGQPVGWLGSSGLPSEKPDTVQAFEAIPLHVDDRFVVTGRSVYTVSADHHSLRQRFSAAKNERLVTRLNVYEEFSALLTDKTLYLFSPSIESAPVADITWRGAVHNLSRVLVAKVDDGYLVSFILGRQSERDVYEARQSVGWVGADGTYEVVVDQPLLPGPPAWSRHRGFIASTVMQHLHDLVLTGDVRTHRPPASVAGAAVVLALVSAAATAWTARRRRLDPMWRWAWTAAGFLVGLPAFLSFLFLTPSPEPTNPESTNSLESETC